MNDHALDLGAGEEDDVGLAARAVAGESAAWESIVQRYWKSVWNLSRRIVRDQHGAEEVTQETFLLIQERLTEYRGQGPLCGWIHTICRRQAFDELRRRGRRPELPIEEGLDPGGGGPAEERWVRHIDLERALAGLEDDEREALLLRATGYTSEEIGQTLRVAPTTIRSRIARGRAKLARVLECGYGGRGRR